MANETSTNLSLLLELADFEQNLYVQIVLTEFQYFPKLPLEIRLKIWLEAMPKEGRIVDLCYCRYSTPLTSTPRAYSIAPLVTHWVCQGTYFREYFL
jgi:hypothetical protein